MPGPVQLSELVTRVRRRADMENTTFVSDAEVEEYIEQSAGELLDLMIESAGADVFSVTSATNTTSAGTSQYEIQDGGGNALNVYRVLGVDVKFSGEWRSIRKLSFRYRNRMVDQDGTWSGQNTVFYRPMPLSTPDVWDGTADLTFKLEFFPSPPAGQEFRVHYIPFPIDASSGGTVYLQGFSGWDEYVVVDAAMKCLEKEESDTRHLERRLARLLDRIRHAALTMDVGDNNAIGDVYTDSWDLLPEYLPWTTG